jgi:DNA topoisomerase IA
MTGSEGGWRSNGGADVTARFRVRWRKAVSRAITIKARPLVMLEALSVGFRVKVAALHFFRDRVAELQRFEPTGRWKAIARTRLERSNSAALGVSEGVFRVKVRKGALVRATLPAREARPCYTAGFSAPQRTP